MIFKNQGTGCSVDIAFRPFQKGDGDAFRRCIEDFYGDGYPYREYLEEAFLLEQCASGKMYVLCGVTQEGEIVSASAVRLDDDWRGSALLTLRVVKQAYRGMGIGRAQEDRLLKLAEGLPGIFSLYADVMTHNAVSQGSLARRGFVHCGIRLMLYRNLAAALGQAPKKGKMSQAVMCKNCGRSDVGALYIPSEHRKEADRIYRRLGVKAQFASGKEPSHRERTSMQERYMERHHSCIFLVRNVGRDFLELLSRQMERLLRVEDGTALCYLNVKDAAAVYAYEALRQAGFFFTGLKPLQEQEEYMLLSYIGKQPVCSEDIHLSADGERQFSYFIEKGLGHF